jgi:hypothetical protein
VDVIVSDISKNVEYKKSKILEEGDDDDDEGSGGERKTRLCRDL